MPKRPDVFLDLAVIALRKVRQFLGGRQLGEYLDDEMSQAAIERQLEIAGDALGQVRKNDPTLFARIHRS